MMLGKRFRYDRKPILELTRMQLGQKEQVDRKVDGKEYVFERIPCLVCGNEEFEPIAEKDRYGLYYPVVICKECGLVQTNPRMDQDSYDRFYNAEYRKLYGGKEKPDRAFFDLQYMKGGRIYQYLKTVLGREVTDTFVVEIGTGAGGSLKYFKDKGNRVLGLDLGKEYIEYGRRQGVDLKVGMAKEIAKAKERPGLIIYCHVLEHILDPVKELKELRSLMDDSSMIYIEVPGIRDLLSSYDMDFLKYLNNAHTYHFTLRTLTNAMTLAGFRKVSGDEKISSLWMKGSPQKGYQSDYGTLNFLRSLEKKRKDPFRRLYHLLRKSGIAILQKTGMTDHVYRAYYWSRKKAGLIR